MKYINKLLKILLVLSMMTMSGCSARKVKEEGKVIDTSMFLYKVSDHEGNYSYLFGTCHPGRDEIKSLDEITEKVLQESDSIYLECTLDTQETQKYTKYLSYNSIMDLGLEDMYYDIMDKYSTLKGKSNYVVYNVMAISSIVLSDKEIMAETKLNAFNAVDYYIFNYASDRGNFKEVEGLEKQYKMFAELSKGYSQEILEGLKDKGAQIEATNAILDAYFTGDVDFFEKEQNQTLAAIDQLDGEEKEKAVKYQNMLVYDRNVFMKETLENCIKNKEHNFIGVGCRHLYGQKGIIQLLKNDGYIVESMK